jgi:hypothetical protein
VELWIADFEQARVEWGWLLGRLDFVLAAEWSGGQSWGAGSAYLTLTTSPNVSASTHDRRRAGVNHLAFKAPGEAAVDAIMVDAPAHGRGQNARSSSLAKSAQRQRQVLIGVGEIIVGLGFIGAAGSAIAAGALESLVAFLGIPETFGGSVVLLIVGATEALFGADAIGAGGLLIVDGLVRIFGGRSFVKRWTGY